MGKGGCPQIRASDPDLTWYPHQHQNAAAQDFGLNRPDVLPMYGFLRFEHFRSKTPTDGDFSFSSRTSTCCQEMLADGPSSRTVVAWPPLLTMLQCTLCVSCNFIQTRSVVQRLGHRISDDVCQVAACAIDSG